MLNFPKKLHEFSKNDDGIATAWALSWLVLCFAIAGLSIDVTNAWKVKTLLQSTADVAAHAGAIELGQHGNNSIQAAVAAAANSYAWENMNPGLYGDVLIDNDVIVGYWDQDNKVFSAFDAAADIAIPTAVRVTTRQDGTAGASNSVGTFFLRMVWKENFKVSSLATVERFVSQCEGDGMFTNGEINGSAIQHITEGYCWHGEGGLTFAQQHTFDPGTIAGTANLDNCGPSSTSCTDEHNPGVEAALRLESNLNPKVARIDDYILEYQNPLSDIQPDYVTSSVVHIIDARTFDANDIYDPITNPTGLGLQLNAVNMMYCSPGQNISLGVAPSGPGQSGTNSAITNSLLSEFVLVGDDCDFSFDQTTQYEDAVIVTSATGRQTISGSAGVTLGRDDNCTQGGEVVIVTAGSVDFAAQLEAYDLEVVARGNLHLASNGNTESTHVGSNFYIGGDARITSQHTFAGCNGDTVPTLDLKWSYRIVQ